MNGLHGLLRDRTEGQILFANECVGMVDDIVHLEGGEYAIGGFACRMESFVEAVGKEVNGFDVVGKDGAPVGGQRLAADFNKECLKGLQHVDHGVEEKIEGGVDGERRDGGCTGGFAVVGGSQLVGGVGVQECVRLVTVVHVLGKFGDARELVRARGVRN